MAVFSQTVQVSFTPAELTKLQTIADAEGRSVDSLIRKVVEQTYLNDNQYARLEAVRRLADLRLPVSEWEQMERESLL